MGILSDVLHVLLRGRENGIRAGLRRWLRGARTRGSASRAGPPEEPPRPVAPPGFQVVARAAEVPPGTIAEVIVDGRPVALCNVGGSFHAVSAICPHAGGPLADGTLEGATLTCPLHGWSYDVRDGKCFVDEATKLPTREVSVVGDAVCVRISVEAPG